MKIQSLVLLTLFLCACREKTPEPQASKDEPVREYALHGQVLRLDPKDHIAAIKHQAIGDWMGAMTMEFPVKDPKDFDSLHEGETINATVHVKGYEFWVDGVHEDTGTPAPSK